MKYVYLVLTNSSTVISKLIDLLTRAVYTHASIYVESEKEMVSIGRRYTFLPWPAELKHESLDRGFYRVHRNAKVGVYRLQVSEASYERLTGYLRDEFAKPKSIQFCYMGLVYCFFNKERIFDNHMFCSQFVAECLKRCPEVTLKKAPCLTRPVDLMELPEAQLIFKGRIYQLKAIAQKLFCESAASGIPRTG